MTYADVCAQEIREAADDMHDVLETIRDRYNNPEFGEQEKMRQIVRDQLSDIKDDVETIEKELDEAFEEWETVVAGGDNRSNGM